MFRKNMLSTLEFIMRAHNTHTHTHTCTHTRVRTHAHTQYTHVHTHAHTYTRTHTRTHTRAQPHTHTHTHTYTHTYTHTIRTGRAVEGYGLGSQGDRIPVGARFFAPVQTGPGAHPASCLRGTGSLCRG